MENNIDHIDKWKLRDMAIEAVERALLCLKERNSQATEMAKIYLDAAVKMVEY